MAVPGRPVGARPLDRCLGTAGVLFLTLSVTTPASSVFVIVPGMFQVAGSGALWAMLIAGLVCVTTAVIYAELASAWPLAGGEYVVVAHTVGPLAGFVMLGVNIFNNLLFPPVAALGVSAVAAALVPGLPAAPVAVGVMVVATAVAGFDIRLNAAITGSFLLIELAAIGVVGWLGLAHAARPVSVLLLHPVLAQDAQPTTPAAIGVAAVIALFALNGYGAAIYFGEEMRQPRQAIGTTIIAALWITLLVEGIAITAGLVGAPDLGRFLRAADPFGQLVLARGGRLLAAAVAAGVVVALINAVIAGIASTARFFYASARDASWGVPVDRWLGAVHPRLATPWRATLATGAAGAAACLLPLPLLLMLSGSGLVAIYAGMAVAALAGRRHGTTAGATDGDGAGYRMPLYPLPPLLTLAALGYVVWTSWADVDSGRPALIATGVEIAASALYFAVGPGRRPGGWRVRRTAG